MEKYKTIFIDSFEGYFNYLVHEITHPSWHNYFYGLIVISLFFFLLEQAKPWHQKQPRIRKDFWLDGFYMFFNSNFRLPLGPLKYVLNNPQMHIWHHVKKLPKEFWYGCNYGLTLSLWDYLFKTAYIPKSGQDITLGFHKDKKFPKTFLSQVLYPFVKKEQRGQAASI